MRQHLSSRHPRAPRPGAHRRLVAAGLGFALAATIGGCGSGRSPEKFCAVYREEKQAYLSRMNDANGTLNSASSGDTGALFGGLAQALSTVTDLPHMFDRLDKVAPEEIEPDVAAVRDYLQKSIDSAGDAVQNPGGALVNGLLGSFQVSNSFNRVGKYVQATCHES